jgi:hypothetical protein
VDRGRCSVDVRGRRGVVDVEGASAMSAGVSLSLIVGGLFVVALVWGR